MILLVEATVTNGRQGVQRLAQGDLSDPAWLDQAFAAGKFSHATDAVQRITGQPPIPFE